MFGKKKKVYKGSDKVARQFVEAIKASDRSYNLYYPQEYYDCYFKLLSRRYKKYLQEDFQRDIEKLGI